MIHIITTGGTIEGLHYEKEIDKPTDKKYVIENFFDSANIDFNYKIETGFYKDSRFIGEKDRETLLLMIRKSNCEKILVTHGTISMVETASYLGKLNLDKTIVLVGSFILGTAPNSDARFNLGYAICALQTLGRGVYIAMNGRLFSWNNVVKNVYKNSFEINAS